jgi:hypothetical protein
MRTLPECATAEKENEPSDCHLTVYKTNATTQPAGTVAAMKLSPWHRDHAPPGVGLGCWHYSFAPFTEPAK